jgi:hypothetical protein
MSYKKNETILIERDSAGMIMERGGNTIEIIAHMCGNGPLLCASANGNIVLFHFPD